MRALMVPRGAPSSSAISDCVRPPEKREVNRGPLDEGKMTERGAHVFPLIALTEKIVSRNRGRRWNGFGLRSSGFAQVIAALPRPEPIDRFVAGDHH